jgi:hypothetical protein
MPYELALKEEFLEKVLNGSKRTTIRRGNRCVPLGEGYFKTSTNSVPVYITFVETRNFGDLTDEDAQKDGFPDCNELTRTVQRKTSRST